MKKNVKIAIIILIVLLILLVVLLFNLFNNKNKKELVYLDFENRSKSLDKFQANGYIKEGWLQVQGTNIDLPILDLTALNETLDYSYASLTPIIDDTRVYVAGHNVLNVSSHPIINDPILKNFEQLMAFTYYDFAKENLYIQYTDYDGNEEIYEIFGVNFVDYDYKYDIFGVNKDNIKEYLKFIKDNSIYDYDIDVKESDKILTLKTCTRYFGVEENQQIIINARKLRDKEKTYKYDVVKSKNYKKIEKINKKESV